jgi:hypothetical protein
MVDEVAITALMLIPNMGGTLQELQADLKYGLDSFHEL